MTTLKQQDTKESSGESGGTLSLKGIPEFSQLSPNEKRDKFLFMSSIKAPYFRNEKRANIDLICVLDESGSMDGDRIKLLKETTLFIAKNLESGDRLGIVGYSDSASVRLELTYMDKKGKEKASNVIKQIRATGSTALCDGLILSLQLMRKRNKQNPVSSVMLLTDGEANVGLQDSKSIIKAMRNPNFKLGQKSNSYQQIRPLPNLYNNNINQVPMYQIQQPIQQQPRLHHQQQGGSWFNNIFKSKKNTNTSNISQLSMQGKPNPPPQIQIQQPIQQQIQQPIQQQQIQTKQGEISENDTKTDDTTKKGEDDIETSIPCIVNTFGFGKNHNASLSEAIAEAGRGMYAYIDTTEKIAETFAECLGGLISTVAKDIKIKISTLNGCKINKCLSQGYSIKSVKKNEVYEINISDLQSEESRDLVFELSIPKIKEGDNKFKIILLDMEFKNLIANEKLETFSCFTTIDRNNKISETGERNYELDLQNNRLVAAEAMEVADKLANNNKLEEARKVLINAQKVIESSKSNSHTHSINLVSDIKKCSNGLKSKSSYLSGGTNILKMNSKAHYQQRSVQSNAYSSQVQYQTSSKAFMMNNFKR